MDGDVIVRAGEHVHFVGATVVRGFVYVEPGGSVGVSNKPGVLVGIRLRPAPGLPPGSSVKVFAGGGSFHMNFDAGALPAGAVDRASHADAIAAAQRASLENLTCLTSS